MVILRVSWTASVLPISAYNKLLIKPSLKPTDIKLSAYGGSLIIPVGTCVLQCNGKDEQHNVKFYVVTIGVLQCNGKDEQHNVKFYVVTVDFRTCVLQCNGKDEQHNVKFYVVTVDS